ncbi:MAG: M6 family metalloprotease domain-containing protein [Dysgonamonadaceae bacterium]|jgi:M6 family metalloprotease-like protein|nr:M6 family metalloprotease domain-containing protein [Dysgonamonadaceae bacterium]
MFKRIIISVFLGLTAFFVQEASASPANPNPAKIKQPDGAEITIRLKGDENIKWMESIDGYSLMYGKDKYIVYAVLNEKGDMVPSDVIFQDAALRSTAVSAFQGSLKKGLRYSSSQLRTIREINEIEQKAIASSSTPQLRATTGTAKAICALIGFPDKPFTHTAAEFEQLMNQSGYSVNGAQGSVKDFYKENSYGKLDLVVTVVGPYTAAKEWKYYGENGDGANQNDKNVRELATEAANFAFKETSVIPSDYDNDGNGDIDTFHFLYAGYGEESGSASDCIWAHKSGYSPALTFGSKKLSIYSCSPELRGNSGNNITHIGVICHELCHVFGAPDYYDTNGEDGGDFTGTGRWDLMAQGSWNGNGASPAHINMYQKIVFGWVEPAALTRETTVSGMPNSAENPVAYTISTTTSGEYFVLENRQKVKFDSGLPGSGLLIYRVSSQASGNRVSNSTHPQQVYPVCASSLVATPTSEPSSYGNIDSGGCPFPGSSGNAAFSDYSTPSSRSWGGNNTSKPVTEITENNKLISFSFMKTGAMVSNVRTGVNGRNVTISWDLPQGAVPDKYAIYRDDQTLAILADGSVTSYTQYGVSAGTYTYCVAPVYGVSESSKQCAAATVAGAVIDCSPVKNLEVTSAADMVILSWSPAFDGGWITHSGDVEYMRGYNTKKFTYASRWTVDDLKDMWGSKLTKVRFAPTASSCEYTIKVWSSAPNVLVPTLLTEQRVYSFTVNTLMDITLTNPITFDDTGKEYWIGIECNITASSTSGIYPAASDNGPQVSLRNLTYISRWEYTTGSFNWSIAGFLESPELKSTGGSWVAPSENTISTPLSTDPVYSASLNLKFMPDVSLRATTANRLSGYNVYRDGSLILTTKNAYFSDSVVSAGNHIYCVSSIYGDCESEQTCGDATSVIPPDRFPAVNNFVGLVEKATVTLTWDKPEERGGRIGYSPEEQKNGGGIGSSSSALDFDVAIRYAAGDLKAQNGTKLTKIRFIPGNLSSTYSIRVWEGGNSFAPGSISVDQPVTPIKVGEWQEVILKTPIQLDIYKELWIGIHCMSSAGQYPAAYDKTDAVAGKGDLICIDGKWSQASGVISDFNNNWCIAGILEPEASFSAYGVYRNGELIGTTNTTVFGQSSVPNGSHLYGVSAMYSGKNESKREEVVVGVDYTGMGLDKVLLENPVNVFPNPVTRGDVLTIDLGIEHSSAEVSFYNISGQLVKKESIGSRTFQCNIDLPPGTYLMQVHLENGKINILKIIVR